MYAVVNPDHDSIFGMTICGVPNPLIPHQHPYPTRYHGPWFGTLSQSATYRERPYQNPVYAGPGLSGDGFTGPATVRLAAFAIAGALVGVASAYLRGNPKIPAMLIGGAGAVAADLVINHASYFG